jgi:hypothetical protein
MKIINTSGLTISKSTLVHRMEVKDTDTDELIFDASNDVT